MDTKKYIDAAKTEREFVEITIRETRKEWIYKH